jgi:hypothetical protein
MAYRFQYDEKLRQEDVHVDYLFEGAHPDEFPQTREEFLACYTCIPLGGAVVG